MWTEIWPIPRGFSKCQSHKSVRQSICQRQDSTVRRSDSRALIRGRLAASLASQMDRQSEDHSALTPIQTPLCRVPSQHAKSVSPLPEAPCPRGLVWGAPGRVPISDRRLGSLLDAGSSAAPPPSPSSQGGCFRLCQSITKPSGDVTLPGPTPPPAGLSFTPGYPCEDDTSWVEEGLCPGTNVKILPHPGSSVGGIWSDASPAGGCSAPAVIVLETEPDVPQCTLRLFPSPPG